MPAQSAHRNNTERGVSDIVGIVTLLGVALLVIAGTGVLAVVYHVPEPTTTNPSSEFSFEYESGLESDTVTIEHVGGDAVPPEQLRVEITGADPVPNEPEFYWASLDDSDPVFTGSQIIIDGAVLYEEDQRADLSGATIELYVEDADGAYLVGTWSGHDAE